MLLGLVKVHIAESYAQNYTNNNAICLQNRKKKKLLGGRKSPAESCCEWRHVIIYQYDKLYDG